MAPRADQRRVRTSREPPRKPRFEVDRVWLLRAVVAVVALAGFLLIGKVSMMAFSGGGKRLERYEQRSDDNASSSPKDGAAPSSPR